MKSAPSQNCQFGCQESITVQIRSFERILAVYGWLKTRYYVCHMGSQYAVFIGRVFLSSSRGKVPKCESEF
jgi:hypothetical protein